MKPRINRHGTPLGKRGYVQCQQCKQEVEEISKDTAPAYARCKAHWLSYEQRKEGPHA